jgi:hypothetical protein
LWENFYITQDSLWIEMLNPPYDSVRVYGNLLFIDKSNNLFMDKNGFLTDNAFSFSEKLMEQTLVSFDFFKNFLREGLSCKNRGEAVSLIETYEYKIGKSLFRQFFIKNNLSTLF